MAGSSSSTGSTGTGREKSKWAEWTAAIAASIAVVVSFLGLRVSNQVKDRQTQSAHQTDVTARYSATAQNLGSDKRLTRESALYALKDLARDDPRGSCREAVQLLSTYLRWASPNVVAADAKPSTTSDVSVDEIWVAAGMVATGTRLCKSQPEISIDVHAVNLRGAYLAELVAKRSELSGTKFDGTDLSKAEFSCTTMTGATFISATLKGATFDRVLVDGVDFSHVDSRQLSAVTWKKLYWDQQGPMWPGDFHPPKDLRTGGRDAYTKECSRP